MKKIVNKYENNNNYTKFILILIINFYINKIKKLWINIMRGCDYNAIYIWW